MSKETDIHHAIVGMKALAEKLGIKPVEYWNKLTHRWFYSYETCVNAAFHWQDPEVPEAFCGPNREFMSPIEMLGYLRAIDDVRNGTLKIVKPKGEARPGRKRK